jgi:hypothetical protein
LVPLPVYKVNGDLAHANFRLAPVVNGKVWCLHFDTLEPFECAFTEASGCTLECEGGLYTTVGQLISRDGEPGGPYAEYVVAAKISDDLTVPCIHPSAVPGVPPGCELGGAAVRETVLSASNATGQPLRHHCRLSVCTSSHPHPDGAQLVGSAQRHQRPRSRRTRPLPARCGIRPRRVEQRLRGSGRQAPVSTRLAEGGRPALADSLASICLRREDWK